MAVRIQLRRDTAANWVANNPTLREGELGIETDTLKIKIGNGSAWNSISNYANVVPSDLNTTLGDYVTVNDIGAQGGVVGLNNSYNAIIPGSSIIIEGPTADSYETTLTVTDPTADRTITFPDSDGTVALTSQLPTQYTDELAQDAVAAALAAGTHTNITVTYNDNANTLSLAAAPGYVDEQAVDAVAAALAAGTHTNITVTYSDETNAISLTGATTYSDENAQDAVGNAVGTGLSYNDSTGAISVDTATIQARVADVSDTEIGYLNGVTSAIQTQIDSKLATSTASSTYAPINNPTFTGTVTLPGNPSTANEAATKSYVDNISAGLNFHAAVHAATTADLSATYDNSAKTLSASGAFPQIDGHTIAETERVLVKSQTNAVQNGIYTLTDDGDPSGTWVLTRASDADNSPSGEIAYGDFTFVQNGSSNGGSGFIMTTTGTITLGTSNINYTQFNTGQAVTAGNGLTEPTAGTLAIDTSVTVDLNTAQTLTNKTITGTFTGNLTGNADTVTNGVYTNTSNTITAASASTKPLIIKAAASQSANIFEWQNSSGAVLGFINSAGFLKSNYVYANAIVDTADNGSYLAFNANGVNSSSIQALNRSATQTPLIVKGYTSQSANLQEWQNSSGTVLSRISSSGNLESPVIYTNTIRSTGNYYPEISMPNGGNLSLTLTATNSSSKVVVKGSTSNSSQIVFETQNGSSSTALSKIDNSGNLTAASLIKTGGTSSQFLKADGSVDSTSYLSGTVAIANGGTGQTTANAAFNALVPSQTGNSSKYLTTDGTNTSWATLVVPIETGTATVNANTATTVDTTALSAFTSIEYMVSLKQGSKIRTSKVVVQTDGTSVDMTEFAITETGGTIAGVVVSATTASTNAVLQLTATDAETTNVTVKFSKVKL